MDIIAGELLQDNGIQLQLISNLVLPKYLQEIPEDLQQEFDNLKDAEISTDDFIFYSSVASVFSSKIEGEIIELDSYIKHKRDEIAFQPDFTLKTDDLYSAYLFAETNKLKEENVKEAHRLLSKQIVANIWQGKYRTQNMYVTNDEGRIEYVAAKPLQLTNEMIFFNDLTYFRVHKYFSQL